MKITDNVHSLKIPFQVKISPEIILERFVNINIIFSDRIYLIDTGVSYGKDTIFNYIKECGRDPKEIEKVFITHAHPDHIGALKLIKEETGCIVLAHKKRQKWIENTDLQFQQRPVPGFNELVAGSCKIDEFLEDGDVFKLGEKLTMKVMYTPGHSDDSISFYFEEDKILVSGDLILLPGDMPIYDDYNELIGSLNRVKEVNVAILLSSWQEKKIGPQIQSVIDESIAYLNKIDKVVQESAQGCIPEEKMLFCSKVLKKLGLPKTLQNPLVAGSFISHLNK